jgi:hypothetical protein
MVKDLFSKVEVRSLSLPTRKFRHLDTLVAYLAYEFF